jgi:hypothetical protein
LPAHVLLPARILFSNTARSEYQEAWKEPHHIEFLSLKLGQAFIDGVSHRDAGESYGHSMIKSV